MSKFFINKTYNGERKKEHIQNLIHKSKEGYFLPCNLETLTVNIRAFVGRNQVINSYSIKILNFQKEYRKYSTFVLPV